MNVAERAKEIQTDSDVKVRELAKILGISEHNLGNYLNGKRTIPYDVLVEFARFYHVTTDYLLGLTDDPQLPYPVSRGERGLLDRFRTLSKEQRELVQMNVELMVRQNQR